MGEKRYRIWSAKKNAYVYLTNVTIIHYFDGKCTLEHAHLPEEYKACDEFPGYGFHPSGDSVIRWYSDFRNITAVRELTFSNDWSVVVTHLDGHKVRLNKRQIAELAGNDESEYAPEPEPISVCPAFFAPRLTPAIAYSRSTSRSMTPRWPARKQPRLHQFGPHTFADPILALCATPTPQTRYRPLLGPAKGIPASYHEPGIPNHEH